MAPPVPYSIARNEVPNLTKPASAKITDVRHLASYNWIASSNPTIAIPGSPARWRHLERPQQVPKDSGKTYISQNAARHPEAPMEPIFRALEKAEPAYNWEGTDVVTDRNNLRKLLGFVQKSMHKSASSGFFITTETIGHVVLLNRIEKSNVERIPPGANRGYGHEFERRYTESKVLGSSGHHRIVSYRLGGLGLMVRHEVDGYVESTPEFADVTQMVETMSMSPSRFEGPPPERRPPGSNLTIREDGKPVPRETTMEIKTRSANSSIRFSEVASQLWISQTPLLVRAYHHDGQFRQPEVENVNEQIVEWEESRQNILQMFVALLTEVLRVARSRPRMVLEYDSGQDQLSIRETGSRRFLPEDIYVKMLADMSSDDHGNRGSQTAASLPIAGREAAEKTVGTSHDPATRIQIGSKFYDVPLEKVPYLKSFVGAQRRLVPPPTRLEHPDIPMFGAALRGISRGYRCCFQGLGVNMADCRTLCDTFDFLGIDVLEGQSLGDITNRLKSAKPKSLGGLGDTEGAQDAAFVLLYYLFKGSREGIGADAQSLTGSPLYNAVFFVVSHPATFKHKTRRIVLAAYGRNISPSANEMMNLNRWLK